MPEPWSQRSSKRAAQRAGFAALLAALLFSGPRVHTADCNSNRVEDVEETGSGESFDCNGNDVPDECEFAPLRFGPRANTPVLALRPRVTIAADVNGDGWNDLLYGSQISITTAALSVLLNGQDGTFAALEPLEVQASMSSLVASDLDNDGSLDLLSAHSRAIVVQLGVGDGTFMPQPGYPVPSSTRFVTTADVTGDGLSDAIASNTSQDTVLVLANEGGGVLAEPISLSVGDNPVFVATGDLNGDGQLDLVTANRTSDDLTLLFLQDNGSFAPPRTIDFQKDKPSVVRTTDVDADGDLDLAVAYPTGLAFLFNSGDGTFGPPLERRAPFLNIASLVAADLDRDGDQDFVLGSELLDEVAFFLNDGTGNLGLHPVIPTDVVPEILLVSDLDRDGDLDIGAFNSDVNDTTLLWNNESNAIAMEQKVFPVEGRPHSNAIGDLDGDGTLDIITVNGADATTSVLLHRGAGDFAPPLVARLTGEISSVALGDLDGDADLDVVASNLGSRTLSVSINGGRGDLNEQERLQVGATFRVEIADMNGDGSVDVLSANRGDGTVTVLYNDGGGSFERSTVERTRPGAGGPLSIAVGDLNGDAQPDIVAASGDVVVLFNRGDETFSEPDRYAVVGTPQFVRTTDLDLDGDLDVVSANAGSDDVVVFRNDGEGTLAAPESFALGRTPLTSTTADLNGDGFVDVVTCNEVTATASVLLGRGDGTLETPAHYPVGEGPRFISAGDLDGDGDVDLTTADRQVRTATVLYNQTDSVAVTTPFLETVCTPLDFHNISVPSGGQVTGLRSAKYVLPAREDAELLPALYQNSRLFALHQSFLVETFPERFPALGAQEYNNLVARRETRDYFVGVLRQLRVDDQLVYGFSVVTDGSAASELLTLEETRALYENVTLTFQLGPVGYAPEERAAREVASGWTNPGFPIYIDSSPPVDYIPYTVGVGYGRVRLLDEAAFKLANETGDVSFQSILVLSFAPRDIEGVVGGVVTAEPQGELSHLAIRTARRGTPNAFVQNAHEAFLPHQEKLVRFEAGPGGYLVEETTLEEAQEAWSAAGPRLPVPPEVDAVFAELSSLEEIAAQETNDGVLLASRFGGKASQLARLQSILDGRWQEYREEGFAVPARYYFEFIRSNRMPSALDASRMVTYEEYLLELFADPEFASNSRFRFDSLDDLRDHMRDEGLVDPELLKSLRQRIATILGSPETTRVRFRSSSNIEDGLDFNGAGLYDSTSGCALDDFDGDDLGPSLCDPERDEERGVARALKKVWGSLWNFRAYEERAFFDIPQELATMAVLVNRTFIDEAANGVAFTGNPSNPLDRRYVITVQAGEESVVSPAPGVRAEKVLLEINDGEVASIIRAQSSSLVDAGANVLSDTQLQELGRVLAHIDASFPIELGQRQRNEVLLDLEFKVLSDGELAIKQVRPFLLSAPPPPAPIFELQIPESTTICGVFSEAGESRGPREEYALKSQARLRAGTISLPTSADVVEVDLFDEILVGPDLEVARPTTPGEFTVRRIPAPDDSIVYRFNYFQEFELGDGQRFEVSSGPPLEFRAVGDDPLEGKASLLLDDEFFARLPSFEIFQGAPAGDPRIFYGSCTGDTLPLWEIQAELEDGSSVRLRERFLPVPPLGAAPTGPALLAKAEVEFAGTPHTVTDYVNLIYSAFRHNRSATYWVVMDPPLEHPELKRAVHALELKAPEPPVPASASYLDENFAVLRQLAVLSFGKEPLNGAPTRFQRGDVNADQRVDLTDVNFTLNYLFLRGEPPNCRKAADSNDDGRLNVMDALALIGHLFRNAGALPTPAEACGLDPTPDGLGCETQSTCP